MPTPTLDTVLVHADDVLHRDLEDGTVLVDLRTGTYFGLNAVGSFIWSRLDGASPLSSVLDDLLAAFEVEAETARADLLRIGGEMAERGLVRSGEDGAPA